jgi:DNA-binding winged helix-turn-helix (wHTH) protein
MNPTAEKKLRYRFSEFIVSPSRRLLLRRGEELPLIPRYFDLLVLLIERRNEAVRRREIFDSVWSDVVVTDGALSQAVRILRKTLGDDPRSPTFIRTVSRHGYRFSYPEVIEDDDGEDLEISPAGPGRTEDDAIHDPHEAAITTLLEVDPDDAEREDDWREAAETLHVLGTTETLNRLDQRQGHERARAFLRETRWDVPGAGPVPIFGQSAALETVRTLIRLRLRRAFHLAGNRWASGVAGGALAGVLAGLVGGSVLHFGPGSTASTAVLVALPLIGLVIGGLGAAGVGAGLAAAETVFRSYRGFTLIVLGAIGGGGVGATAHFIGRLTVEGLFGRDLSPVGGGLEGLVIGGAAGLGYALATPRAEGGMASPRGKARLAAALASGLACALAGIALAWTGSHLGAMSLDFMARSFPGSQVGLDPLAHLLGETTPGPVTRSVISAWEGLMFGFGLIAGLTRRPKATH